jgi:hypothetical protein
MRIRNVLLATAFGLGVAGWSLTGSAQQDLPRQAGDAAQRTGEGIEQGVQRTGEAIQRGADKLTGATQPSADAIQPSDQTGILIVLREVTDAAMTKGGFDDMVERFSDADRARLNKDQFTKQDHATLDGRVAQFQKDWQAKYNQQFKITDAKTVFNDETLVAGNPNDNARLASERQQPGAAPADQNRNEGKKMVFVIFPAANGLPETRVPFVQESMGRWKIDVPDSYSAQQIHDNVLKQLTTSDENKTQWPADANDAYENVAHRVFIALINPDAPMGTDTDRPGTGMRSPGGTGNPPDRITPSPTPVPSPLPRPDATPTPNPAPTPNP